MDCNEENCGYHQTKTLSKMNKKELYEFSKIASEQNFKITHFTKFVVDENNELKEEIKTLKEMVNKMKIINLTDEQIKLLKEIM